jgi:hypothetical protein
VIQELTSHKLVKCASYFIKDECFIDSIESLPPRNHHARNAPCTDSSCLRRRQASSQEMMIRQKRLSICPPGSFLRNLSSPHRHLLEHLLALTVSNFVATRESRQSTNDTRSNTNTSELFPTLRTDTTLILQNRIKVSLLTDCRESVESLSLDCRIVWVARHSFHSRGTFISVAVEKNLIEHSENNG